MQINSFTLPLASLLRQVGCHVRIKGWNRLLQGLFPFRKQRGTELTFQFLNYTYTGKSNNYIDWAAFFYGAYEKELLEILRSYAVENGDCIFIDAGANVGHHSLYMSAFCKEVHAFEPLPALCDEVKNKINTNHVDNIYLHPCGLGNANGEFEYYLPDDANLGQGSFVRSRVGNSKNLKLQVFHAGHYFERNNINKIDIIKIDVEGYEPDVLLGLKGLLASNRPLIVVEIGDLNRQSFQLLSDMKNYLPSNYRLMYQQQDRGILIRYDLTKMSERVFKEFGGNLVCFPC